MANIYIAGKITGLPPQEVIQKFHEASSWIKKHGYTPILPPLDNLSNETWCKNMLICLQKLMGCEAIYLLKDWQESEGAKIEYQFAKKGKLYIIYQKSTGVNYLDDFYPLSII